jgi:hypothetical protein
MNIRPGMEIKAKESAGADIRKGRYYKIESIIKKYHKTDNIIRVSIGLGNYLRDYPFSHSFFNYYFGEYTIGPGKLNKKVRIL